MCKKMLEIHQCTVVDVYNFWKYFVNLFTYLIYLNLCFDKYYNYLKIVRCTERRVTSFSNVLVQGGFVVLPAIHIITKKTGKIRFAWSIILPLFHGSLYGIDTRRKWIKVSIGIISLLSASPTINYHNTQPRVVKSGWRLVTSSSRIRMNMDEMKRMMKFFM